MEKGHAWTVEEDRYCCRIYIWYMFALQPEQDKAKYNLRPFAEYKRMLEIKSPNSLIGEISNVFDISEREISVRLQKIKAISNEMHRRDDTVPIRPFNRYTKQLKDIFLTVIDEIGQEIRKATFPNNIEERMAVAQEKINECGRVLISEDPDDNWEEFLEE